MKKAGDYLVYKRDVCKIKKVYKSDYNGMDYYDLYPVYDESLKISIPVNNINIRDLMTLEEVNNLIKMMPEIRTLNVVDKQIENEYKKLLTSGNIEDLVILIKTSYLRNKDREDNNKKIGEKDKYYFDLAENFLYNELAIVLNKSIEETKEYILNKINI